MTVFVTASFSVIPDALQHGVLLRWSGIGCMLQSARDDAWVKSKRLDPGLRRDERI